MKARDGKLPDLKLHPLCAAWPEMTAAEFADLKADIAKRGVYDPVIVLDGMILDGQHRYRAARELGIPAPMTLEFSGKDPAAYVIGKNARRRHMSKIECARAVARCLDWRPRQGGRPSQKKPCQVGMVSHADMATAAGVGERTMSRAKHDVRVESGEVPATPKPKPASTPKPKRATGSTPKEKLQQEVARWKTKALNLEEVSKRQKQKLDLLENAAAGKTTQALKTVGALQGEVSVLKKQVADWMGKYRDEVRAHTATKKFYKRASRPGA